MAKVSSIFSCQKCGAQSPRWIGRCPECEAWNSYVEEVPAYAEASAGKQSLEYKDVKPQKLSDVKLSHVKRIKSGFSEFDRVLGGGMVPGSVVLVAGDPGVGKSTLLLQVVGKIGGLYVSGEESVEQVSLRAKRLGVKNKDVLLLSETRLEAILSTLENFAVRSEKLEFEVGKSDHLKLEKSKRQSISFQDRTSQLSPHTSIVIVDSIQTIGSERLTGVAGSAGQIRECSQELIHLAKKQHIAMCIIGHVTKEGIIAGPKLLEHMVDVVCYVEGDRHYQGRMVRTFKNRFGPTDEVGIFEMEEEGLVEVANPSKLFLQDRVTNTPGSCIAVTMEGTRPLLVEIQSLTVSSQLAIPRRVVNGININRLQMILAVLQKRLGLAIGGHDVFVNVSGGLRLTEPAADLAVALSIVSAFKNTPLPSKLAAFGELGLLGEIKQVAANAHRIREAKRLGYTTVVSAQTSSLLTQLVRKVF